MPRNLTLIGMPGCGKSTVGRLVAERLGWAFLDLDAEIERIAGRRLWEINAGEGFAGLRRREEAAAAALDCDRTVIAPGGSVVYGEAGMRRLRAIGRVVYLTADAATLERRAGDLVARGVVIAPGMTYADLVAERDPLYRRWADATVDCGSGSASSVARAVLDLKPADCNPPA